jgi:hypothetical protein
MTDSNVVTMNTDRLTRYEILRGDEKDSADEVGQMLLEDLKEDAEALGYLPHPTHKPELHKPEAHTDYFVANQMVVVADYPIMMTREQWLMSRLQSALRSKRSFRKQLAEAHRDQPLDDPYIAALIDDLNFYEGEVDRYFRELREERRKNESA